MKHRFVIALVTALATLAPAPASADSQRLLTAPYWAERGECNGPNEADRATCRVDISRTTGLMRVRTAVARPVGVAPESDGRQGMTTLIARDVLSEAVTRVRYHVTVRVESAFATADGFNGASVRLASYVVNNAQPQLTQLHPAYFEHTLVEIQQPVVPMRESLDSELLEFDVELTNPDGLVPAGTVDVYVHLFAGAHVGPRLPAGALSSLGVGSSSAGFHAKLVQVSVAEEA